MSLSGGCRIHRLPGLGRLVQLRYPNLSWTRSRYVPRSIGNLKELRYFDLSDTEIKTLPRTLVSLPHLHTLILRGCDYLWMKVPGHRPSRYFPIFMIEKKSLVHIDTGFTYAFDPRFYNARGQMNSCEQIVWKFCMFCRHLRCRDVVYLRCMFCRHQRCSDAMLCCVGGFFKI